MKRLLLGSACALALASPAFADQGISMDAAGSYGNIGGFPAWTADGEVNVPLNMDGLSVDGAVGDAGAGALHIFNAGGNLMWSDGDFRLAATADYNRISKTKSIGETQLGLAGQWFATPWLTATATGGAFVGNFSGGYVTGNLKGYVTPDLAFDGFGSYFTFSNAHIDDFGIHGEYLPFEQVPVSVGATWDHFGGRDNKATGFTDAWFVVLKLYLNDFGATTLEDRQKNGPLDTMQPSLHYVF